MSAKSADRVNRTYSNLHTDQPVQETDDRLEKLIRIADDLKGMIDILNNPHSRINKTFIASIVEKLWERYFMIQLKILEYHPETKYMNQNQRAQRVREQIRAQAAKLKPGKISPIEKSLKTISRWDALKTDDMM